MDRNCFIFYSPILSELQNSLFKERQSPGNPGDGPYSGPPSVSWSICESWAVSLDRGLSWSVQTCRAQSALIQGVRMTCAMLKELDPSHTPDPSKICLSWWCLLAEYLFLLFTYWTAPGLGCSMQNLINQGRNQGPSCGSRES